MNAHRNAAIKEVIIFVILMSLCIVLLWDMSFWMMVASVIFVGLPQRRKSTDENDGRWQIMPHMYSVVDKQKRKSRPPPSYSESSR